MSSLARASSRRMSPYASSSDTGSGANVKTRSRIKARASFNEIMNPILWKTKRFTRGILDADHFCRPINTIAFAPVRFRLHSKPVTLTAALFNGGESRRMGTDKATLNLAGKPLWLRQLETLRSIHPDKLLISARVRPVSSAQEIEIILDEPPSRGPLSGLLAAMKFMKTTHLLTLAIDLPRMTADHLLQLMQLASTNMGVILQRRGSINSYAQFIPLRRCDRMSHADGRLSLQSLVNTLIQKNGMRIHSVSDEERDLYSNLNTPDDVQRYRA